MGFSDFLGDFSSVENNNFQEFHSLKLNWQLGGRLHVMELQYNVWYWDTQICTLQEKSVAQQVFCSQKVIRGVESKKLQPKILYILNLLYLVSFRCINNQQYPTLID
eukprot:TRINITY_DN1435_c0_g3_i1.p8 TRINITY_DN1435_c0_g3~~TRINITY_DN1435_c0_g3_i1.p8  ORF type:complete len:107 (-),score=4.74 TRINITY_DN1435_c0_g3_i1:595-915(-)